jgi:hypothetical protein
MNLYYFTLIMRTAFQKNPHGELVSLHQCSNGWAGIIKDKTDGTEYVFQAVPVKSEKVVAPNTADQLLRLNEE